MNAFFATRLHATCTRPLDDYGNACHSGNCKTRSFSLQKTVKRLAKCDLLQAKRPCFARRLFLARLLMAYTIKNTWMPLSK